MGYKSKTYKVAENQEVDAEQFAQFWVDLREKYPVEAERLETSMFEWSLYIDPEFVEWCSEHSGWGTGPEYPILFKPAWEGCFNENGNFEFADGEVADVIECETDEDFERFVGSDETVAEFEDSLFVRWSRDHGRTWEIEEIPLVWQLELPE